MKCLLCHCNRTAGHIFVRSISRTLISINPTKLLLGADVFAKIFVGNKRIGKSGEPVAFETEFGWILTGEMYLDRSNIRTFTITLEPVLDSIVKKFWELEEVPRSEERRVGKECRYQCAR